MISLIICSRNSALSSELSSNILDTIGCECEIIVIDNSNNNYSLYSAYNEGVRRATGDILCFMHDDVLYKTINWGIVVEQIFQDNSIGVIGVAGGKFLPPFPASWFTMGNEQMCLVQHYETGLVEHVHKGIFQNYRSEVVAVDGFWFCMKKHLFNRIVFDESLGGFHAYDLDICMQVNQLGLKNYVFDSILIEHFSCGTLSSTWLKALVQYFYKWENYLPCKTVCFEETRLLKKHMWWKLYEQLVHVNSIKSENIRKLIRHSIIKMPIVVNGALWKIILMYFKSFVSCQKS